MSDDLPVVYYVTDKNFKETEYHTVKESSAGLLSHPPFIVFHPSNMQAIAESATVRLVPLQERPLDNAQKMFISKFMGGAR